MALGWWVALLPEPLVRVPFSPVLEDQDGRLLSARTAADGQWRFPPGRALPERYRAALLTFEDRRFATHPGVDPWALGRALGQNLAAGGIESGASTLTMQAARLLGPTGPRGLDVKLREALLALRLELTLSKDEILTLYAALAPFGGNVVGLEAAAWRWFGRQPDALSWAESALLAVLPHSPGLLHPGRGREALQAKRDRLLRRLAAEGRLDSLSLQGALAEELPSAPRPLPQRALPLLEGLNRSAGAPRRWTTSLDGALQDRLEAQVADWARAWRPNQVNHAAVLVWDLAQARVAAYVPNIPDRSQAPGGALDLVQARRSTGSLLKPFLYASALDSGELLPNQLLWDLPTRVGGYVPENHQPGYFGALPARQALALSLNIPFVRLLRSFGVDRFAGLLRRWGLAGLHRRAEDYGLPLILGGAEASLWELTQLYARLALAARGAVWPAPGLPAALGLGPGGAAETAGAPPWSAGAAALTLEALLDVTRPGDEALWRDFAGGRAVAWKTGTSHGFKDAWALGSDGRWLVGVWAGNADGTGRPRLQGSVAAAPLLFAAFALLPPGSWPRIPEGSFRRVDICADSGHVAGPFCPRPTPGRAPAEALWPEPCPYCRPVTTDRSGRWQADRSVLPAHELLTENRFILPPGPETYYRRGHPQYRPLPPPHPGLAASGPLPFTLFVPEPGSRLFLPRDFDGRPGELVFLASHRDPGASLDWHLNGRYLGRTVDLHSLSQPLSSGEHSLTLTDSSGQRLVRRFTVLAPGGEP